MDNPGTTTEGTATESRGRPVGDPPATLLSNDNITVNTIWDQSGSTTLYGDHILLNLFSQQGQEYSSGFIGASVSPFANVKGANQGLDPDPYKKPLAPLDSTLIHAAYVEDASYFIDIAMASSTNLINLMGDSDFSNLDSSNNFYTTAEIDAGTTTLYMPDVFCESEQDEVDFDVSCKFAVGFANSSWAVSLANDTTSFYACTAIAGYVALASGDLRLEVAPGRTIVTPSVYNGTDFDDDREDCQILSRTVFLCMLTKFEIA